MYLVNVETSRLRYIVNSSEIFGGWNQNDWGLISVKCHPAHMPLYHPVHQEKPAYDRLATLLHTCKIEQLL